MRRVKLLHWNILFSEKSENIISLVKELNSDILCVQEINEVPRSHSEPNLVTQLLKIFPYHYFEAANLTGSDDKELKLGNAVFSKFPIDTADKVVLYNKANPTSKNKKEQRVYIEAVIKIDDKKLTVGTTHLSFAPRFEDTPDRLEQTSRLIEVIKKRRSNYIITGDFNSAPDTKIIKEIQRYLVSAGPEFSQPTFTTIPFSFLGFDVSGLDWRVDYIFATRDVKVESGKIISTKFSDHLPILVEIEV